MREDEDWTSSTSTFAETLPEAWRPVAPSLWSALRNGIVHGYTTKAVVVDGRRIEIGVSWRQQPHLSLADDGSTVFLNVEQMADDLRDAFDRYENMLRSNGATRDVFQTRRRKDREEQPHGDELAAWQALVTSPRGPDR